MRYADGSGLTTEGPSRREQVRLQATEMFEHDTDARQVAESLRVSTKSVYQWRRAWQAGSAQRMRLHIVLPREHPGSPSIATMMITATILESHHKQRRRAPARISGMGKLI
jgi:hypothetical protein